MNSAGKAASYHLRGSSQGEGNPSGSNLLVWKQPTLFEVSLIYKFFPSPLLLLYSEVSILVYPKSVENQIDVAGRSRFLVE